jgi:hypothetical protein
MSQARQDGPSGRNGSCGGQSEYCTGIESHTMHICSVELKTLNMFLIKENGTRITTQ